VVSKFRCYRLKMAQASLGQILGVLLDAENDLQSSQAPGMEQWRQMFRARIGEAAKKDPAGAELHLPAIRAMVGEGELLGAFPLVAIPAVEWLAPLLGSAAMRYMAFAGVLTISGMHAQVLSEAEPVPVTDGGLGELVERAKQKLDNIDKRERRAKFPVKTTLGLTGLTAAWLLLDDYTKRLVECADAGVAYFLVGGVAGYIAGTTR